MPSDLPIEELYFQWLYDTYVGFNEQEPETHWRLMSHLQHTRYVWSVPNDDNRAEDGVFLRETFIAKHPQYRRSIAVDFLAQDCSVLEFLIALSERAEFESMRPQMWWFWEFINNLRLLSLNDTVWERNGARCVAIAYHIIEQFLNRQYNYDGTGGLFPLEAPPIDQRRAEVWYQMSTYILEHQ